MRAYPVVHIFGALHSVHFYGNNPGRNGYNGIAHYHDNGCKSLSKRRYRRYIAIAHRGQGYHRPIDAYRDPGKASILAGLYHIQESAQYDGKEPYRKEEYKNLAFAFLQRHW